MAQGGYPPLVNPSATGSAYLWVSSLGNIKLGGLLYNQFENETSIDTAFMAIGWAKNKNAPTYEMYSAFCLYLVPRRGLEPPHPKAHGPEPCASTNSAIWAFLMLVHRKSRDFISTKKFVKWNI